MEFHIEYCLYCITFLLLMIFSPVSNSSMLCAVQFDRHHRDLHHWVHRIQGLDLWLLELSLSGEGKVVVQGETVSCGAGKAILYKPYAEQNYGFDATGEWTHFWATFSPRSHWKPWLNWEGIENGMGQVDIPLEQLTVVEKYCQLAVQHFNHYHESKWDWVMLQLEAIFLTIFESGALPHRPQKDQRIQKACAWMQEHLKSARIPPKHRPLVSKMERSVSLMLNNTAKPSTKNCSAKLETV